jgi:cyclopropane-fatty-acyl-phospholipid synthase
LLRGLGSPPLRIVLAGGEEVAVSQSAPVARIVLRDRATLWKLAARPRLEFGEAYSAGRLEVEGSLLDLMIAVYRAAAAARKPGRLPGAWSARLVHWLQSNTLTGSKRHIHHHYDIGNEFYELWLDKDLVYTCAYFPTPSTGLEEAQQAKMDHVCRKLWLRPGETVVEAGCGWGSLALYMARHYGVSVKAFNISHEQIAYARRRAEAEGLASRVEFIEDDYRNIAGQYDVFVSVGMLEHVGPNHYRELGRTVDRVLSPTGRGLIHSIGQNCSGRSLNAWIRRRIFPGAYAPGLKEIAALLEPWSFSVLDVENLRLHYAETLRHWLARFEAAEDRVLRMFDPTFVRMWRLYLAGSMAAFLAGELQLFQVVFARPQVNAIPWTRAGVYSH